jgi:rhamnogalacturonan endolyase
MRLLAFVLAAVAARAAVKVEESPAAVTAANGCLTIALALDGPQAGRVTSLRFRGAELLGNGGSAYTLTVDSFGTWGIGRGLDHTVRRGTDFADVAAIHRADDAIPMEYELHYVLRDGECGFHEYSVYRFRGSAAHAADTIGQLNTTLRADPKIFRYHSSELYWTRIMPLPEHVAGPGNLQDATYNLTPFPDDPYYAPPDRWNYTKYDFSAFEKRHRLHGIYGGGYGIWCIHTPRSKESWNGGPTKQNLTVHQTATTPVLLNEYFNGHYAQGEMALRVAPGWEKTFGPWFFYVNASDDYAKLWQDAARFADPAAHRAFYDRLAIPGYVTTSGRATVRGTIRLATGDPMGGTTVVLSDDGVAFDRSHAGFQYWADAADDGSFVLPEVRPGTYRLSAYRPGVFDDFHVDGVTVANGAVDLGARTWTPESAGGTTVLEIGTPDRTAMEFRDGDRYKHYGLFNDEGADFPNGVHYLFGGTSDREGWFFTEWRSYRENFRDGRFVPNGPRVAPPDFQAEFPLRRAPAADATAELTIALASAQSNGMLSASLNGNPPQVWRVQGTGSSAIRSGASGVYESTVLRFPASQLRAGQNTLRLRFEGSAVQYDAVRLAVAPADATLVEQPDLTISKALAVKNVGRDASRGPVTVTVTFPAPAKLSGTGWTCGAEGYPAPDGIAYECVRRDALAPGQAFPAIAASGRPVLAVVAGGGDVNPINNVAAPR